MFIENDEHIVIMEDFDSYPFSIDDIKKLEDASIKTVYMTNVMCWDDMYSRNDWSSLDGKIEKYEKSNMKLVIPFYGIGLPQRFMRTIGAGLAERGDFGNWSNYVYNSPNYGDEEYIQAVDNLAHQLFQRVSDFPRPIQFSFSIPQNGEFPFFPHTDDWPYSNEVLLKFIVDRQRILNSQYGEVWTAYHNLSGLWNAKYMPLLYDTLRKEFPDSPYYAVQFGHFVNSLEVQMYVAKYAVEYGVRFLIGSNYVEGLITNFDAGAAQNIWGFLTAPLHGENPVQHKHIEDWMIPVIRTANEKLREAYK